MNKEKLKPIINTIKKSNKAITLLNKYNHYNKHTTTVDNGFCSVITYEPPPTKRQIRKQMEFSKELLDIISGG